MERLSLSCVLLLLAGCATVSPELQPVRVTVVVCPPVVQWEEDLQKRAGAELEQLPPKSALRTLTARAIKQRDLNRKCLSDGNRRK